MKVILEMTEMEAEEAIEKGLLLPLLKQFKKNDIPEGYTEVKDGPAFDEPATPVQQATPEQVAPATAVPTTSKTYSVEEITKAAISLMDKGKATDLQNLLQSHGISALPQLPAGEYGKFALELRELGAEI